MEYISLQVEKQLQEQLDEQASLQAQLAEAEAKAELSSNQAASLLSRERQLLHECRALQREVDKLRLELTKIMTRFLLSSLYTLILLLLI